ncbi:MAG: amino acid racemase [candidate division WOR-3 bacterium]|nr:MAG: amino acid racemase [candidate division WOR-3 bacterium]
MRKIGIIGGLGPEATIDYYRTIINECRVQTQGDVPEIVLYSLNLKDFPDIDDKDAIVKWLLDGIKAVHHAGADFAIISANTPHIVFDRLKPLSPLPLLSIVEETGKAIKELGALTVGLFGTKVTMSSDFYQRVFDTYSVKIVVPLPEEQDYINHKISSELMFNNIVEETRNGLLKIAERMVHDDGIQALILGCTELPLILTKDYLGIHFLNTTRIHALAAIRYSLTGE